MSSSNNSFYYGFVTYIHEVSIDYAIQLFKGIKLFSRELSIKKKGRSTNNGLQYYDIHKQNLVENSNEGFDNREISDIRQTVKIYNRLQSFAIDNSFDSQQTLNFKQESLKGNWSNRNKLHNYGFENHFPRSHRYQNTDKGRKERNKPYHRKSGNRKNRNHY